MKKVSAIPTAYMAAYVAEMRRRLLTKQIGAKREFLQEVVKEVRVRGNNVTLTEAVQQCKEPLLSLTFPVNLKEAQMKIIKEIE